MSHPEAVKSVDPPSGVKGRVLIIDDEAAMGNILVKSLALDGFEAVAYTDPLEALEAVEIQQPDIILTDVRMPGMTGGQVLERVKQRHREVAVLVMTAFGTIEDAVAMLQAGAFNYITKPFQHSHLVHQLERALENLRLRQRVDRLSDQGLPALEARSIIGSSAGLERVRRIIHRAATIDSPVLITGESGVGKELVAREIHRLGPRKANRFVAVNCPAIPPTLIESELFGYERGAFTGADQPKMGLIELSAGGSLFLDEIAEIPAALQAKLLRVIQEREVQRLGGLRQTSVDLRIIAATNRDLDTEIAEKRFRTDLYFRLNVVPIEVPPLRDRPEDIPELIDFFMAKATRRANRPGVTFDPTAARALGAYAWPGNIRELENTLERIVVLSEKSVIDLEELNAHFPQLAASRLSGTVARAAASDQPGRPPWPESYKDARETFEREFLLQLVKDCGGNVARAARRSGIPRRSLYEKFDRYGIDPRNL